MARKRVSHALPGMTPAEARAFDAMSVAERAAYRADARKLDNPPVWVVAQNAKREAAKAAEAAKADAYAATCTVAIKNHRKGTTLHLGDGRKLAFGECAEVPPEVLAAIVAIGSGE